MNIRDVDMKLTHQERFDLFAALCFWINNAKPLGDSAFSVSSTEACRERMKRLRERMEKGLWNENL
jgi:hypothetical protein